MNDLDLMALKWLDSGPIPANLDGLGNVDWTDFAILAGDWGQSEQTGSVTVMISGTIPTGGQWRIDSSGPWHNSGETASGIAVGLHTVTFVDIPGFDKPADEPVTIDFENTTVVTAGAYIQHTGTLVVNISPPGAIAAGAQWRVDGGPWHGSGSELAQVVGTHTVEFSSVGSWQKPGSVQTEVLNGTQAVVNRSYVSIQSVTLQITEFMADNDSRSVLGVLGAGNILDGDLLSSDWIEIYNNSGSPIDLGGKYLTDEANQKTKWQFPAGMPLLQSGHYLIVFASGKTQEENLTNYPYWDGTYYHTNFQLDKGGEYLALIDSDGLTVIHEYDKYPDQEENVSYGIYNGDARYFSQATPGAANTGAFTAFVKKPKVNIEGGCYENALDVILSCDTVGASIRYTTDGTAPTESTGTLYTGPIHLDSLTALVAKGFKTGFEPSKGRIETYIFVDPAVNPSNTNLPIVVVDTLGVAIPDAKDQPVELQYTDCRIVIVDVDDATGRARITGPEHFAGIGQIKRRGESTYGQGHYGFEILDEYRQDKDVSLLDMPAESDWILSVDVIDYTMMKNEISYKWFRDMGHYAPRQRYVEVYLNTGGGAISSSDYNGLYMLREKIKPSKNRVDIARMDALHNAEPQVSGGYIFKCDKPEKVDDVVVDIIMNQQTLWESAYYNIGSGAGTGIIADPDSTVITDDQIDWAISYLNEVHSVFWQNTGSSYYPGPAATYNDYVDAVSWIDHGIVEQIGNDADAFWGSYYVHKDRNGKVFSGPTWDFDRSFHNNGGTYDRAYDVWRTQGEIFGKWHQRLQLYLEYRMQLADRWFEHRETVLNTALTQAYIDEQVALISEAKARCPWADGKGFTTEIDMFKTWITNRLNWLDGEIASRFAEAPPILNPVGGYVNSGTSLDIVKPSGASGDIYYTLNGEDPRTEGGGINPNALVFDGATIITDTITMVAEDAAKAVLVPSSNIGTNWTGGAEPYDDSAWTHGTPTTTGATGGVGYDEASTYVPYITYDVISQMIDTRETCYIRIPFTATAGDLADAVSMTLRIRYDDGFRAFLNGTEIASDYAPSSPNWDTGATGQHNDNAAVTLIDFDCSAYISSLQAGDNILAIRGFNRGTSSSDFLISAELVVDTETVLPGSGSIIFDKSTCVKARIKNGSNWSAMNTEVYAVGPVAENLRITELMYHPTEPTQAEIDALAPDPIDEDFEFIELKNIGGVPINLNLVHFTDGIDFTFGDVTLDAGDYAVLVKNQAAFAARYNTAGIHIVPGSYLGFLNNDGEEIVLRDAIGTEIHDFDYKDGWYELTDGKGYSLTLVDPNSTDPNNLWDSKAGWRSSLYVDGTPGRASETVLAADSIVINEVLAHSHAANPDWIELYNKTPNPIDISGWFLSDDDSSDTNIRKYEFQAGSIVPAYGYLVLEQDDTFGNINAAGCHIAFGLSEGGEAVYLYSGAAGAVTGFYQTQQAFDASETDVTFGRYEKTELSGGHDFVRQSSPSKNSANNGPLIPDIVITEIHYNPPAGDGYEFVELYNRSGSDVLLETEATTETSPGVFVTGNIPWRLEGTGYEFPAGVTIPSHSYILVAKNPATYSSAPCAVYGPYDGKLDNGGEELEIQIPGDQEYGQSRYWIPIEKIDYDDIAPWATSADGGGDSLHRDDINAYGRDYSNWNAATPTPGS